jgi:hypothetical protein
MRAEEPQSSDLTMHSLSLPPNGTFTANPYTDQRLLPCQTQCDLHRDATVPTNPRAKILQRGQFHLFKVHLTDDFKNILSEESVLEINQGIIPADSEDESKVILDVDQCNGDVVIEITGFSGQRLHKCRPDQKGIQQLLFSMAQWDWHLYREPEATPKARERAQLSMYRLSKAGPVPVPLDNDGVDLTVISGELYGFRLKSLFNRRLYAYLFYFGAKSQSISKSITSSLPLNPWFLILFRATIFKRLR